MKPYYYVYRTCGEAPTRRHNTIEDAIDEAKRLASKHPGIGFEVLRCVAITAVPTPMPSLLWLDGEGPAPAPKPEPFERMDDSMPCPPDPPRGWLQIKKGVIEEHDWLMLSSGQWAIGLIGRSVKEARSVYRQPDRF